MARHSSPNAKRPQALQARKSPAAAPKADEKAPARRKREPRTLTIFISYASEDLPIADGIAKALASALPDGFAKIYYDKWALDAGEDYRLQLKSELEQTKNLLIVSTGVYKDAYAYPAWEVGFFESLLRSDPSRKIIPLYVETAPPAIAGFQGFDLQVPLELLPKPVEEFKSVNEVRPDDRLVELIQSWQTEADEMMREVFGQSSHHVRADAVSTVKAIRVAVFNHMKTKIQTVMKPQKQITVKTTGADLGADKNNLPPNAMLVPAGGCSMEIFGLPEKETPWARFLELTSGLHQDGWREAINSVVQSGDAGRLNVDNSQVIVSSDESKSYRVILTAATIFRDDRREFNLYFVERLKREDHGDQDTSRLLKGLEAVCRYRFLFLERNSVFTAQNILSTPLDRLPQVAAKLLSELNLMRQDSQEFDLEYQAYWTDVIGGDAVRTMREEFYPRVEKIRELCGQALKARDNRDGLAEVRGSLHKVIADLEETTKPFNSSVIKAIGQRLLQMVA